MLPWLLRSAERARRALAPIVVIVAVLASWRGVLAQDAQDQERDGRAALQLAAGLPPSVYRAVLIPSGEAIRRAVGDSASSWAAISSIAMPATARNWSHFAATLGWEERQAFDGLFGGASALVFTEHHEGDAPIDRRDRQRPDVWALIGEASEATEARVRDKLELAVRATIAGQAVLAIEDGELLLMFIKKRGGGGDGGVVAEERPYWWLLVPAKVIVPAGAPGQEPRADDGAGIRVLRSIAPMLAGDGAAGAPADVRASEKAETGGPAWSRLSQTPAFGAMVRSVHSQRDRAEPQRGPALAVYLERLAGWSEFAMVTAHAGADRVEFVGLATWSGAGSLVQRVARTPDSLLEALTPAGGSTLIEMIEGAENPLKTFGHPLMSGLVREAMGPCVGSMSVAVVRPATDVQRADGQTAWRLMVAQQLCAGAPGAGGAAAVPSVQPDHVTSAARGLDLAMTKLISVFEIARVSGPPAFPPGRELVFDDVPPGAARSTMIRPAIGSFYLRLLSSRAAAWWSLSDSWGIGAICAQGGGEGAARVSDAAAIERERIASEALVREIRGAMAPAAGGESRAWLSRAVVETGPIRQSVPVMFGPGTPPGVLLAAVRRVRWGAWVETAGGVEPAPAGGEGARDAAALGVGGGLEGRAVGQIHLYLRIELEPPGVPKP